MAADLGRRNVVDIGKAVNRTNSGAGGREECFFSVMYNVLPSSSRLIVAITAL